MEYIIYFQNENKFVIVNKNIIFDLFYNTQARIWFDKTEIEKFKKKKILIYKLDIINDKYIFNNTNKILDKNYFVNLNNLKKDISKINNKIPLYDVYSNNLYLIFRDNVYNRVIYDYYRFPDSFFYNKIKNKKITDFLNNFDLPTLENTYINIFYYYSNKVGKNLTLCLRPSFLSHLTYIKPYYTRSEVINMALNMELIKPDKTYYTKEKLDILCDKVRKNDINRDILLNHQKYIVKSNGINRVIYYSLHGAYFMNKYLRNKLSENILIEKSILGLSELIKNAPAFDKNYKLYRFINSDNHINHLKVGDIYTEKSFMSTTRNPFYNSDLFKFGFILILIRIPSNIKGVALCMETFSNFKEEEEIILAPLSKFKLISKNNNSEYYHIDDEFSKKVVIRYEFEYIGSDNIYIEKRINDSDPILLNIHNIDVLDNYNFYDKAVSFSTKYTNNNYQFISKINNINYTFVCEWYNSTSVYEPYYFIKNENGFCIYCQNPNTSNLSLTIELSSNEIHINYYSKFSYSDDYIDITTVDAIKFICRLAYIFSINKIYIHQEYKSCKTFINKSSNVKYKELKKRILEMYSYRKDYYDYFINKSKRFNIDGIYPKFYYYQLDTLFNISPLEVLNINDKDELYQIYQNINKKLIKSFVDFYIHIIQNRPDLINILENKTDKIFKKDNPFIIDFYLIEGFKFLYNNKLISSIPNINNDNKKESKFVKILNKSTYRLDNIRLNNIRN